MWRHIHTRDIDTHTRYGDINTQHMKRIVEKSIHTAYTRHVVIECRVPQAQWHIHTHRDIKRQVTRGVVHVIKTQVQEDLHGQVAIAHAAHPARYHRRVRHHDVPRPRQRRGPVLPHPLRLIAPLSLAGGVDSAGHAGASNGRKHTRCCPSGMAREAGGMTSWRCLKRWVV